MGILNRTKLLLLILICCSVIFTGCREESNTIATTSHSMDWANGHNNLIPGAILVPENHNEADGRKITITYLVMKARDTTSSYYPIIFFCRWTGW